MLEKNSEFIFTQNPEGKPKPNVNLDSIGKCVYELFRDYSNARLEKEEIWMEAWSVYQASPQAMDYAKNLAQRTVGNANVNWRHKVSTGKAFETVETINSYLQSAFFPNREWFDMVPLYSGSIEVKDLVKTFLKNKLKQSNFRSHWDLFIRQMLITGTSVLALPWRKEVVPFTKRVKVEYPLEDEYGQEYGKKYEYKLTEIQKTVYNGTEFETLSMFDCFFDPDASDINNCNFIRRMQKTKGEVLRLIENGFYKELDPMDVVKGKGSMNTSTQDSHKQSLASFMGIQYRPNEFIDILEFWGNLETPEGYYEDVVVTCFNNKVMRFENNPYWGGKPFVCGTYIPIVNHVYGFGTLEPVLGLLHELCIVTNQRLDNLELSLDTMWTYVDDGVLNPEDIYTAPGKVLEVADHNSLRTVQHNQQFTVSYQEAGLLEQNIDKVSGTGSFIGVGQGRSGERVTAQEVQATRDAGGNRLGGIHRHIEQTALYLTLKKVYRMCQQFVTEDEVIRFPGFNPGEFLYVEVGAQELANDFDVEPVGAGHIADKEYELQKRLDFIGLASQNPEMAQQLDWVEIMKTTAKMFGFDDIDRFIKKQPTPEEQAQAAPQIPQFSPDGVPQPTPQDVQALMGAMGNMGGEPAQAMAQTQLGIDGGVSMTEDALDTLGIE